MVCRKYADYRFLSKFGDNGDLHLAGLNVKNILSSIALCKNHCAAAVFLNYEACTGGAQKYARIEMDGRFGVQVTPFSTCVPFRSTLPRLGLPKVVSLLQQVDWF